MHKNDRLIKLSHLRIKVDSSVARDNTDDKLSDVKMHKNFFLVHVHS